MPRGAEAPRRDLDEWSRLLAVKVAEAADPANETEMREHVHGLIVDAVSDLFGVTATAAERAPAVGSRRAHDRLYGGVAVAWEYNMGVRAESTARSRPLIT